MLMRDESFRDEETIVESQDAEGSSRAEGIDGDQPLLGQSGTPAEPVEPAPPITSRFLFVNVAGQRAKQLKRGAFPRLEADDFERLASSKAERVAMAEVRNRLVHWDMPEWVSPVEVAIQPTPKRRRRKDS